MLLENRYKNLKNEINNVNTNTDKFGEYLIKVKKSSLFLKEELGYKSNSRSRSNSKT